MNDYSVSGAENEHVTTQTWAAFGRPDDRRLVSVTDAAGETYGSDRLTSDGAQSFNYDGAGNALTIGAQTYAYTPFNLVDTATVGGALTTYRYYGDHQRRLRVRSDGTKEYFVPGPGLVPLAEYRKAPGGSRVLVREYIYAGDRLIASVGLEPTSLAGVTWTDDPLVSGVTDVKAVHLAELREAVNAARVAHGLGAASWTNAEVLPGVTVIQTVHIAELRTAINAVYTAAGVTHPSYTDPTLVAGVTDIRAVHLTELRSARANAPGAELTATRFYHLDALGSVRAVTDPASATVRRHDYTAFGEAATPSTGADARRFTGKERDAETGLDYFSARYYFGTTGRFTTADPGHVGGDIFDPQSWNAYAYARNNPLRFVDPSGTDYEISIFGGPQWTLGDSAFRDLQNDSGAGFFITPSSVYQRRNGVMTLIGDVRYVDTMSQLLGGIAASAEAGIKSGLSDMALASVPVPVRWFGVAGNVVRAMGGSSRSFLTAANGTKIIGFAKHGINRAIGDGGRRAGVSTAAWRDALLNPRSIRSGIDSHGRPFQIFQGAQARVIVNPSSGQIVSMNPVSAAGVR